MSEWNTPMGRYKMAQQGGNPNQGRVLTVPDEANYQSGPPQGMQPIMGPQSREEGPPQGPPHQGQPQRMPRRRERRRAALSPQQAQEFYDQAFQDQMPQTSFNRVPSPEEFAQAEERERQKTHIGDRISPEAKQRIQLLAGLGSICDDYVLLNTKYTFKSLKTAEGQEVYASLWKGPTDRISLAYKVRIQTLARALTHIDDQPVNYVLGTDDVEVKVYLFEEMDDPVTEHMYNWYQDTIVNVSKSQLSKEEAKELAEDIKKS